MFSIFLHIIFIVDYILCCTLHSVTTSRDYSVTTNLYFLIPSAFSRIPPKSLPSFTQSPSSPYNFEYWFAGLFWVELFFLLLLFSPLPPSAHTCLFLGIPLTFTLTLCPQTRTKSYSRIIIILSHIMLERWWKHLVLWFSFLYNMLISYVSTYSLPAHRWRLTAVCTCFLPSILEPGYCLEMRACVVLNSVTPI